MLAPETRTLLTDALRPPDGFRLDTAVATTYSLDLTALLLAPLSFALHDAQAQDLDHVDPIRLLEAVRRYSEHTTVFCQAGAIHVPSSYRPLLTFAEGSVWEVAPPQGLFHPKVWVLRFADDSGGRRHRLLCLSRNLTLDRSWDTLLRLDEDGGATTAADPEPLIDFVQALPELTTRPLPGARRAQLDSLAQSLRLARLAAPPGFDTVELLPLGLGIVPEPTIPAADRMLAVSAFLDVTTVRLLGERAEEGVLVSRPESFDRVGTSPLGPLLPFVLQRSAEVEVGEDQEDPVAVYGESAHVPEGLHAKTFFFDCGDRGVILTGSANATTAGFRRNVEFDVMLSGPRGACGVGTAWDGSADAPGLSRVMQEYDPPQQALELPVDEESAQIVEDFHALLAGAPPVIDVLRQEDERFLLRLRPLGVEPVGRTRAWPLSLPSATHAVRVDGDSVTTWGPVGLRSITPFLVVETVLDESCARVAVLTAELVGDPAERPAAVLRDVLRSKLDVLRYLVFLLGDPAYEQWLGDLAGSGASHRGDALVGARVDLAVFEPLVRAAARGDDALERVASLLRDLGTTDGQQDLVPDGFAEIWAAVWTAHQEARR